MFRPSRLLFTFAFIALAHQSAQASMIIKKDYPLSLADVSTIETAMITAAHRPDFPNTEYNQEINKTNQINFNCLSNAPSKESDGCSLSFGLDLGSTPVTITKMYYPNITAKQIHDKLQAVNPNGATAPMELGSLVEVGGHYECRAEGTSGAKAWNCYIRILEILN
jgi:hypothetical protein